MDYPVPNPQTQKSDSPRDYSTRIIVTGSTHYNDQREFHLAMCEYVEEHSEPVLFITRDNRQGVDSLVERWCGRFGFPCLRIAADWHSEPRSAGYLCNEELNRLGNHLLTFDDGQNKLTQHLIELVINTGHPVKIIRVQPT